MSKIAELCGKLECGEFNFLRTADCYANQLCLWHSQLKCVRNPVVPHPHGHCILSDVFLLVLAFLMGVY